MSNKLTTFNRLEFNHLLQVKCTNSELRNKLKNSFHKNRGDLREVIGDAIDIIQILYMERTALELEASVPFDEMSVPFED